MLTRNPIFIRFCRSELRFRKAAFWFLLVLIITAFTVAVIYAPQVVRGREPMDAARAALLPLLIIQGILLLFVGTGNVASGITREKVENVLNYQRLTPLPVRAKIIGYLFGLPVRQYALFGITLPFLAFVLIVGRIPPSAFVPYYLLLFTSTLLYHFTGMVAGMISRRWRWSARISQGLIVLLYFFLPQLSQVGLVFLEFLTVRPVFREKILPLVGTNPNIRIEGLPGLSAKSVPFFTLEISGTLFSFIIQAGLIALMAAIVARKWKADSVPAISKRMALTTFAVFAVMALGNVWPNLTGAANALPILRSGNNLARQVAMTSLPATLPLVLGLSTSALAAVLMLSALPDPLRFRHGRIRAERHSRPRLGLWEDDAGGYPLAFLFIAIQAAVLVITAGTLHASGSYTAIGASPLGAGFLIATGALFILYFQALRENFAAGPFAVFVLLHWMLPLLAAILIVAIDIGLRSTALLVAALSPLAVLPIGSLLSLPPGAFGEELPAVHRALGAGLLLLFVLNAWLHWRLRFRGAR